MEINGPPDRVGIMYDLELLPGKVTRIQAALAEVAALQSGNPVQYISEGQNAPEAEIRPSTANQE